MPELTVSRSAWLELKEELRLVNDGYEFLDEKCILLAAEILRQRDAYRDARAQFMLLSRKASAALRDAAADQGLDGLQVYPAAEQQDAEIRIERRSAIGQIMLAARFDTREAVPASLPVRATHAVRACRESFQDLLRAGAELAAMAANLKRLTHEYRRTERRVRALENVVIPEIRGDLAAMEDHLELSEQEEVIRVRTVRRQSA